MQSQITDQQKMSARIYKGLFTDDEWFFIDRALSEYQVYLGDDDSYDKNVCNRVVNKIGTIFRLTENN